MGPEKVEVGHKHGDGGNCPRARAIAIGVLVVALESAVWPFNYLLQWAVFLGNGVIVGQADDLFDIKINAMPRKEMLRQKVYGVSIGDKVEVFGNFAELDQNIVNGIHGGNVVAVSLDAVRSDDFLGWVKKEKDVVPNAADLDICFVAAMEPDSS